MAKDRGERRLTERQQAALAAHEAARAAGKSLSVYAREQGLELRPLYDAMIGLRRRGLIAGAAAPFIAIDVARGAPEVSASVTCRLRRPDGAVIECCAWPDAAWVAAVLGPHDAAA